jgi:F-type H+-transporting ATPase subunit a
MNRVMRSWVLAGGLAVLATGAAAAPARAQEAPHVERQAFRSAQGEHVQSEREVDIMGHLANAHYVEVPCFSRRLACEVELPHWRPIEIGGLHIDLSPTKHAVYLVLAAIIVGLTFTLSARAIARAHREGRPPRGFAGAMEATTLYIRQEVILPNVGHHGEGYVPYLLTVFFFILVCNLLGLVPWGATATGNIAVTGALALLAFLVIEMSGMRTLGFKG